LPIFSSNLYSQDRGILRGLVTDSLSGEALAYGNVLIKELGTGASTDERGYFLISSIPANKEYTLIVSYIGYQPKQIKVFIQSNKITEVDVTLVSGGVELQTVEKVGEKIIEQNATDLSLQRIALRDLERLPKGVETDVIRSLKYISGVQTTGDISAKYYVRGGSNDQNLILVNGIPLFSPFHAFGLFSVIDPDMINNVEFYKGGFPAEYGGRMSSVLRIITKDGNKNNYSAKASASFLTGKALVEGPIPHGSFIFTGRKSYSTEILKKFFDNRSVPIDFYDYSFKLNYSNPDFISGGKMIIQGFGSNDQIKNANPTTEDYQWSNDIIGFEWFQVGEGVPLFLDIGLSLSKFSGEVIPKQSNALRNKNDVENTNLKMDFNYIFESKNELNVGLHINQVKTSLYFENENAISSSVDDNGANISVYGKFKFLQYENLGIDVGIRSNLVTMSKGAGNNLLEPRISITYNPFSWLTFKGAYGIYQQEMNTITDENDIITIFEPWVITPDYLEIPSSTHYIGGMNIEFSKSLTFSAEGYFKTYESLPILNDKKILDTDPDFLAGTGESYGGEFELKFNADPVRISSSYTRAFAYKEVNGIRYYPKYDVRNSFDFNFDLSLWYDISLSAIWSYSSGRPFTLSTGFYDRYYFEDPFADWDEYDPRLPYALLGVRNLSRLPDYHRLDISISKKFDFDIFKMSVDVSFINVYNRKNIFYFKRDTGERVNALPFLPTATIKVEI
jgi:hypothetical protein